MFSRYFQIISFAFILSIINVQAHAVENSAPSGAFENSACIECHKKDNPKLISDWRNSAHASTQPVTDCTACHGKLHPLTASVSRRDSACIDCHGGEKSPVMHSYTTSKHGVIMQLEKSDYDWQRPLAMANYRAPGCSYCHMHQAGHNVNNMIRKNLMNPKAADNTGMKIRMVCQDCHAPRYITSLLANGEDMLEIARKKVREANTLVTQASEVFGANKLAPARKIIKTMQQHLKNVYLGAGHQSPDYQWWYGQPALDGDLLRIKGIVGELHRKKGLGVLQ